MDFHEQMMQRCFHLATCGLGFVRPNPLVGATLVRNNQIVAEGFHRQFGGPHAEVHAFNALPPEISPSECTLYVNLEPCSHFGKTPPCADLVISKGVKSVVISNIDPDPRVSGNGIRKIQEAGIEVISGVLEGEGNELNRRFFTSKTLKRPYIILKWAESYDGFIDQERNQNEIGSFPISDESTRILVHLWRAQESGILVGAQTIRIDNPSLDVRYASGQNPEKIVLSTSADLKGDFNVFKAENPARIIQLSSGGNNRDELNNALFLLNEQGIQSILVEGGLKTHETFISTGIWDEIRVIRAQRSLFKGLPAPNIPANAREVEAFQYGKDSIKIYRNT